MSKKLMQFALNMAKLDGAPVIESNVNVVLPVQTTFNLV